MGFTHLLNCGPGDFCCDGKLNVIVQRAFDAAAQSRLAFIVAFVPGFVFLRGELSFSWSSRLHSSNSGRSFDVDPKVVPFEALENLTFPFQEADRAAYLVDITKGLEGRGGEGNFGGHG